MREATDEIMCRIAVMLPESYRGFYRDHPRLLELPQKN
jgi:1-acyl-sn-glycerol-3-phosphate acyltransferase